MPLRAAILIALIGFALGVAALGVALVVAEEGTGPAMAVGGIAIGCGAAVWLLRRDRRAAVTAKSLGIQLSLAQAERDHAHAIISTISDAVLVMDSFGGVVLANESAARTFDFAPGSLHTDYAPLDRLIPDAKLVALIRDMLADHSQPGPRVVEHALRTRAGEKVFKVTLSCMAEASPVSAAAGVLAVLHDITREKQVAEMKNHFVSSVSHELRTPLASIKAYSEMLVDGEADDEGTRRHFYDVIQKETNRLSRLIDDILNISSIESGLVRVNRQRHDLVEVLQAAMDVIAPQARVKRQELIGRLPSTPCPVTADKDMLHQAVLNLLSNAVKYTPEGGRITVQAGLDPTGKRLISRVCDTGVGIPPKDLPLVFDKFYRVEANNHMAKGTGLGLSLVKQIVEGVHGGRMFVESSVGVGSCFGFELAVCEGG